MGNIIVNENKYQNNERQNGSVSKQILIFFYFFVSATNKFEDKEGIYSRQLRDFKRINQRELGKAGREIL